jgi:hypothetical protein
MLEHLCSKRIKEHTQTRGKLVIQARWTHSHTEWIIETKKRENFYSSTLGQVKEYITNDTH